MTRCKPLLQPETWRDGWPAAAARYLPAHHGDQVGGDWYDAFPIDEHATAAAIGDVSGHDISAAAQMSQLRTIMQTLALSDDAPRAR